MVSFNILVLFLDYCYYYRLDLQWKSSRMSDVHWFMVTKDFGLLFS